MRKDLKLGAVMAVVVVGSVGAYVVFRGSGEQPIAVSDSPVSEAGKQPAKDNPAGRNKPADRQVGKPARTNPQGSNANAERVAAARERGNPSTAVKPANSALIQQTSPPTTPPQAQASRATPTGTPGATDSVPGTTNTANAVRPNAAAQPNATTEPARTANQLSPAPAVNNLPSGSERALNTPPQVADTTSRPPTPANASGPVQPPVNAAGSTTQLAAADNPKTPPSPGPGLEPKNSVVAPAQPVPASGAAVPVGRTSTATPVDTAAHSSRVSSSASPDVSSRVEVHRVQPGDTFASIAQSYYGSERFAKFLVAQNPDVKDTAKLAVGTTIRIPPQPQESALAAKPTTGAAGNPASRTYKVQPGDSFYSIAKTTLGDAGRWRELFAMNKELVKGDATALQIGQVVRLPER